MTHLPATHNGPIAPDPKAGQALSASWELLVSGITDRYQRSFMNQLTLFASKVESFLTRSWELVLRGSPAFKLDDISLESR